MSIGQNIKTLRAAAGMTLEELSKIVGVSRQTLSRYETGVIGNIPSDKIEAIARALNTSPAFLMGWEKIGSEAAPTPRQPVSNDDIRFALFGGAENITEADIEDVRRFAEFIKGKKEQGK